VQNTAVARKIEGVQPEARQARLCRHAVSTSLKEGRDLSLMVRQICTDGASRPLRQGIVEIDTTERNLVSANEYGRVHGFFIGNVFYIVWLDPDHKLYSK
jgi:hypothetical protein